MYIPLGKLKPGERLKIRELAARDDMVRSDVRLLRGLSLVLLAGLLLINLAVLFVLPWQTASAVWGGSGLLIIWLSLHLQQRASFIFGLLLQVVGGVAFLGASPLLLGVLSSAGLRPLAHAGFWTPLVLGLAALVGAWRLQQVVRRDSAGDLGRLSLERLSQLLLVWGTGGSMVPEGEFAAYVEKGLGVQCGFVA